MRNFLQKNYELNRVHRLFERIGFPVETVPSLLKGFGVFFTNATGAVIAFGVQVVVARILGVAEFGAYVLLTNWIMSFVILSRCGFGTAITRFVSVYNKAEDFTRLFGILRFGTVSVMISGLILGMSLVLFRDSFTGVDLKPESIFYLAGIIVPILGLIQINKAVLFALKQPVVALIPEQFVKPIMFLCLVFVASITLNHSLSVFDAFLFSLIASGVALVISVTSVKVCLPLRESALNRQYAIKEWIGASVFLFAVEIAEMILARVDVLILGIFRTPHEIGIYAAATTVASGLNFFIGVANTVIAPYFAEFHAERKIGALFQLFSRSRKLLLCITVPFALGVEFFASRIMDLFGTGFASGSDLLILLVLVQMVYIYTGPVGYVLSMSGEHRLFSIAMGFVALINVGLNLWLVPLMGATGAAIAALLTVGFRCTILTFIMHWRVGSISRTDK